MERDKSILMSLPSVQPETNCSEIPNNSDTISRQAAIEHWRLIIDATSTDSGYNEGFVDGLEFCISHLSTMPSAQPESKTGRWIPVSERLPDKRGDYLVTLCGNGEPWVEIALWNETFGGRWQMMLYNDVDYSDISNVIAWMPLPEPYQEGDGK